MIDFLLQRIVQTLVTGRRNLASLVVEISDLRTYFIAAVPQHLLVLPHSTSCKTVSSLFVYLMKQVFSD